MTISLTQAWDAATPEDRLQAETEARVLIDNLVHYRSGTASRSHYADDVRQIAGTLLKFRSTELPSEKSNVVTIDHEAVCDRFAQTITGYKEGAFTAEETFNAIIHQIFEETGTAVFRA
jgi:hypothetical protein